MDIYPYLTKMQEWKATDLYMTVGVPGTWRGVDFLRDEKAPILKSEDIYKMLESIASPEQLKQFKTTKELNLAVIDEHNNRYRVNVFMQQQKPGMVIRRVSSNIPDLSEIGLPPIYKDAIMQNRGLILVVGPSGSGKSTSIASMLDYRNKNSGGHIVTIEDPLEYIHEHKKSIFTQREIGFDTTSWQEALKNALRQRPDVIFIGEIRDAETMKHALNFAETGHLCIATLHSTSASQTIERVTNFFTDNKPQYLYSLAQVLKYIFAQRLVKSKDSTKKIPAIEVLVNVGFMKPLITEGKIPEIKDLIARNSDIGMTTFENSLKDMLKNGLISEATAIAESDNPDNMRLHLMKSKVQFSQNQGSTGQF